MPAKSFNTGEPLAFFITWTSYGTWLPGDERGWYRRGDSEPRPVDELIREMAIADMKETPFTLSEKDRQTVENTVTRHCEIRGWTLHAVNARTNHVHVVVTAVSIDPKKVRDQFKAWCTRHLKKNHPGRQRFWTEGGSCRSINTDQGLLTVVEYVNDAQDRKGME